jgi:hypothetical protein
MTGKMIAHFTQPVKHFMLRLIFHPQTCTKLRLLAADDGFSRRDDEKGGPE